MSRAPEPVSADPPFAEGPVWCPGDDARAASLCEACGWPSDEHELSAAA